MVRKKGLGRGLDALLGGSQVQQGEAMSEGDSTEGAEERLGELAIDLIERGRYQPRMHMDPEALEELAASIRAQGVVQPVVVRPIDGGKYELIAGERRWRASRIAGLATIPAVIRDVPDEAAVAMALIENIQREDLNPLEEAMALQRLIDEFSMTHQTAADAVGRSRAAVSNLLRLLDLDQEVKLMLEQRQLDMGHARALLPLEAEDQIDVANRVVKRGLSVRDTEQLVRKLLESVGQEKVGKPEASPRVSEMQERLSSTFGLSVAIRQGRKGGGKVVISYGSEEELDGLLAHIK